MAADTMSMSPEVRILSLLALSLLGAGLMMRKLSLQIPQPPLHRVVTKPLLTR